MGIRETLGARFTRRDAQAGLGFGSAAAPKAGRYEALKGPPALPDAADDAFHRALAPAYVAGAPGHGAGPMLAAPGQVMAAAPARHDPGPMAYVPALLWHPDVLAAVRPMHPDEQHTVALQLAFTMPWVLQLGTAQGAGYLAHTLQSLRGQYRDGVLQPHVAAQVARAEQGALRPPEAEGFAHADRMTALLWHPDVIGAVAGMDDDARRAAIQVADQLVPNILTQDVPVVAPWLATALRELGTLWQQGQLDGFATKFQEITHSGAGLYGARTWPGTAPRSRLELLAVLLRAPAAARPTLMEAALSLLTSPLWADYNYALEFVSGLLPELADASPARAREICRFLALCRPPMTDVASQQRAFVEYLGRLAKQPQPDYNSAMQLLTSVANTHNVYNCDALIQFASSLTQQGRK